VLTDHLCSLHFAPTHQAKENLLKENIEKEKISSPATRSPDALFIAMKEPHTWGDPTLKKLFDRMSIRSPCSGGAHDPGDAHRRENHGAPLDNVFSALRRIVDSKPGRLHRLPRALKSKRQKSAKEVLAAIPDPPDPTRGLPWTSSTSLEKRIWVVTGLRRHSGRRAGAWETCSGPAQSHGTPGSGCGRDRKSNRRGRKKRPFLKTCRSF